MEIFSPVTPGIYVYIPHNRDDLYYAVVSRHYIRLFTLRGIELAAPTKSRPEALRPTVEGALKFGHFVRMGLTYGNRLPTSNEKPPIVTTNNHRVSRGTTNRGRKPKLVLPPGRVVNESNVSCLHPHESGGALDQLAGDCPGCGNEHQHNGAHFAG